jgi:hypothetical protein
MSPAPCRGVFVATDGKEQVSKSGLSFEIGPFAEYNVGLLELFERFEVVLGSRELRRSSGRMTVRTVELSLGFRQLVRAGFPVFSAFWTE